LDFSLALRHTLSGFAIAGVLALPALSAAQVATGLSQAKLIPGGPQTILAPIAGLDEFTNWQLTVVNRSPRPMAATITIYALNGTAFAPVRITLASSETRNLDVKTLLPQEVCEHNIGSTSISFTGEAMGVGAQVTMSGHHGFGNMDVPAVSDSIYRSNTADAVWWEPVNSRSYVILSNSSRNTLEADITYGAGGKRHIEIAPHATVIQKVPGVGDGSAAVNSAHVVGTGEPGTLRMIGYIVSDDEKFINTLYAVDPASSTESAVYANGLHFSGGVNHLVVKNVSTQALRVSATIFPVNTGSSTRIVSVPPKSVDSAAAAELDLTGTGNSGA
jgi:hypothetical protein